jgi:hypothetical protein
MLKKIDKTFCVLICAVLVFQLVGCGTIMYPERKGQKSGQIDVGIAVLDGIGLLFFLIPGIIAYAVDFNNGTIYLPGTSRSSLEINNFKEVKFDPKNSSMAGYDVNLYDSRMQIVKLRSSEDMLAHFEQALPGIQNTRIVLLAK